MKRIVKDNDYFLSIDIDFFNLFPELDLYQWLCKLYSRAEEKKIKFTAVMNHQQILPVVNSCKSRILVNIDQHSDLDRIPCTQLDCGSWVGYVKWRDKGTYLWIRSDSLEYGNCGFDFRGPDCTLFSKSFAKVYYSYTKTRTDWHKVRTKYTSHVPNPKTLVEKAEQICICLSPAHTESRGHYKKAYSFIKDRNIPYKKGIFCENNIRKIKPPAKKSEIK